ncbi:MAG: 2-amino-4-hydroxy-6-hydroxymethyldihydropteridine diphosphokinase [Planctomycetota bacterium]|nr:2-amino-4-hydroxy-6-hydroxymethyldihydropteridine diphosphokinase [Planctomycetota bacterium]MDA1262266.1 2-amino-4-hydroxy-6-hydroxymethyldihydropteridine diphosphokinase [Planctomycetota bacterium]
MKDRVFIGIGSNVGDRVGTIDRALELLGLVPKCRLIQCSSLWETEPVGPPQPKYLNAAAEIHTELNPFDFLSALLEIERSLGRIRSPHKRNAPRTIDLDLLLFGNQILMEPNLEIPHPRLAIRPFVIIPLLELDPVLRHPATGDLLVSFLPAERGNDGVVMWRTRTNSTVA